MHDSRAAKTRIGHDFGQRTLKSVRHAVGLALQDCARRNLATHEVYRLKAWLPTHRAQTNAQEKRNDTLTIIFNVVNFSC